MKTRNSDRQVLDLIAAQQAMTSFHNARDIARYRTKSYAHEHWSIVRTEQFTVRRTLRMIRESVSAKRWRNILDHCRNTVCLHRSRFTKSNV